jgi:hypothetical protein
MPSAPDDDVGLNLAPISKVHHSAAIARFHGALLLWTFNVG